MSTGPQVDGLDQPEPGARPAVLAALHRLTGPDPAELGQVRVIATVRSDTAIDSRPELAHAHRLPLQPPEPGDLVDALTADTAVPGRRQGTVELVGQLRDGGWLIARLLTELRDPDTAPATFDDLVDARLGQAVRAGADPETTRAVIAAVVAAGPGPVLPVGLLGRVVDRLGQPASTAQLRDVLVQLGAVVSRGRPGQPDEQVGIAHAALAEALRAYPRLTDAVDQAHHAYAAISREPVTDQPTEVADYLRRAAPRHHLLAGDSAAAVTAIAALDGPRAADNRDHWADWLPTITTQLGPDHPDTLTTRGDLAYWQQRRDD